VRTETNKVDVRQDRTQQNFISRLDTPLSDSEINKLFFSFLSKRINKKML